jgi:hypothetical protein
MPSLLQACGFNNGFNRRRERASRGETDEDAHYTRVQISCDEHEHLTVRMPGPETPSRQFFVRRFKLFVSTRAQHTVLRLRSCDVLTLHLDDGDVELFVLGVFPLPHLACRRRLLDSALVSVQLV